MDLSTILPGILLLGIVIFFHELGHFLAAKWRGVTVLKFSLGMGPEMIGFTSGGTRYCFSWIPLGGFVQMAGDSPNEDGSLPEGGQEQFLTHHWFGRLIIAVAGPAANLVTAYVVMTSMCLIGLTQPDWPNVLGPVPDTTAAYAAGMREGDVVKRVGATTVRTWHDIDVAYEAHGESTALTFMLDRAGTEVALSVPGPQIKRTLADLMPQPSLPVVGTVLTGMPAYRGGVREGDTVVAVDGKPVRYFMDIGQGLRGKVDTPVKLTVERDGKPMDLTVTPLSQKGGADRQSAIIGIEAPRGLTWKQKFTLSEAVKAGFYGTGSLVSSVYGGMWMTVSRPLYYREYVGGPIFIAQMARDSARKGIDNYLYFLAMINIAIMAFNLLPIPLLDGGHILLALLEAVRRRSISARTYINFQKVGLVLVGTLFVLILSKDIVRPFQRMRALDKAPGETTTVAPSSR
ncbi:MAG: RIP metalloprotease RseP [Candidatus Eisenbacteria bacterium]|uniref:Zinc metalloprotease n=1 Tax=Eiseniibacteriota bacterium TaxID=2212470 RepID=A0A933W7W5_UNCEI|nr:RIP metalloprotease RseP [Candidatus Eisenbacteria bacterium]